MVDFNADIVSFTSLGNVRLGDSIDFYLDDIFNRFNVEIKEYSLPAPSIETRYAYLVDKGTLTIATTTDDIIVSLGCNENYSGKYKNRLSAGMTMGELLNLSTNVSIVNGALIIDNDYGLSFTLPSPYDEIADSLAQIPDDVVLNQIYVSDHSAWKPR
ncbi:hypothetical protein [Enterobacter sp. Bisph1]|uniref:hypothetical protein n=1 Tax=Enterobacter sp. Bisph1 TaxID=1274399 RepID=UPI000ABA014D|nr:hypothetical protein [Enterobacter sp. Bisph1]